MSRWNMSEKETGDSLNVVVGFDNAFYQGTPLPAPIPGTGTPGCLLQVEPDASLGLVPHGGALGLFVTPIPSLAGLQLYWQALAFDPALSTPVQLAVTDFLVTTIGM